MLGGDIESDDRTTRVQLTWPGTGTLKCTRPTPQPSPQCSQMKCGVNDVTLPMAGWPADRFLGGSNEDPVIR